MMGGMFGDKERTSCELKSFALQSYRLLRMTDRPAAKSGEEEGKLRRHGDRMMISASDKAREISPANALSVNGARFESDLVRSLIFESLTS